MKYDLDYLQSFIDEKISENTNLEFKKSDALNHNAEIAKDISAMANSNGGEIIYGLWDENKDQIPEKITWHDNPRIDEKIMQIIQTSIVPKIEGIEIFSIRNPEDESKFAFVVKIPKSENAPHQIIKEKERRYWRRYGSITRQMEHYEIEDLFFKRKRPILELDIEKNQLGDEFKIIVTNKGKVLAEKMFISMHLPKRLDIERGGGWTKVNEDYVKKIYQHYSKENIPLYPEIRSTVGIIKPNAVTKKEENTRGMIDSFRITFLITCESGEIQEGEINFDPYNRQEDGNPIKIMIKNNENKIRYDVYVKYSKEF